MLGWQVLSYNLLAPAFVRPVDLRTGEIQPFAAFQWASEDCKLDFLCARIVRVSTMVTLPLQPERISLSGHMLRRNTSEAKVAQAPLAAKAFFAVSMSRELEKP